MTFIKKIIIFKKNQIIDSYSTEKKIAHQLHTIEGVYDGEKIQPLQRIKTNRIYRVIITFLEEIEQPDNFRDLKIHSENKFEKLWKNENDEIWASYL